MESKNSSSLSRLFHKINRPFWISLIALAIPLLALTLVDKGTGLAFFALSPIIALVGGLEYLFAVVYIIVSISYLILRLVKKS